MSSFGIGIFARLNRSKLKGEIVDCANSSLEEVISRIAFALGIVDCRESGISFQTLSEEIDEYSPDKRPLDMAVLNFDSLYRSEPEYALEVFALIYRAGIACEKAGMFWNVRLEIDENRKE